ncbi:MAG: DUF3073 domain-containing protein [Actinobacteria bacterium]|nr:DUF3073 domain-containing protein [Actinomycetota bacterium]
MGRGRAKAKQTKVARDLKYNSQDMDLDRLAKEPLLMLLVKVLLNKI